MTEPQRFSYSTAEAGVKGGLPFVRMTLIHRDQRTQVSALVDSGATVNVLPYEVGVQLGLVWEEQDFPLDVVGVLRGSRRTGCCFPVKLGRSPLSGWHLRGHERAARKSPSSWGKSISSRSSGPGSTEGRRFSSSPRTGDRQLCKQAHRDDPESNSASRLLKALTFSLFLT